MGILVRTDEVTSHGSDKVVDSGNFSITKGGALYWLLVRLRHAGDDRKLVLRRSSTPRQLIPTLR